MDNIKAINMLWGMAADSNGLELESKSAQVVQKLRSLADLIEHAPQNVVSLVLIAGEKFFGDEKGVSSHAVISGTSPAIAASFLILEEVGRAAMKEMVPHLLVQVIADAVDEGATPADLKVN